MALRMSRGRESRGGREPWRGTYGRYFEEQMHGLSFPRVDIVLAGRTD